MMLDVLGRYYARQRRSAALARGKEAAFGGDHVYRAAATGRIGGPAAARAEIEALLAQGPDFDAERFLRTVPYGDEGARAFLLEALRTAGL